MSTNRCCNDRLSPGWVPWSEWMTVFPGTLSRRSIVIARALVVSAAPGMWLIDQPRTRPAVQHDHAVDLALTGRMPSDVGQPELVRAAATEDVVDEILGRRDARCISIATVQRPTRIPRSRTSSARTRSPP